MIGKYLYIIIMLSICAGILYTIIASKTKAQYEQLDPKTKRFFSWYVIVGMLILFLLEALFPQYMQIYVPLYLLIFAIIFRFLYFRAINYKGKK